VEAVGAGSGNGAVADDGHSTDDAPKHKKVKVDVKSAFDDGDRAAVALPLSVCALRLRAWPPTSLVRCVWHIFRIIRCMLCPGCISRSGSVGLQLDVWAALVGVVSAPYTDGTTRCRFCPVCMAMPGCESLVIVMDVARMLDCAAGPLCAAVCSANVATTCGSVKGRAVAVNVALPTGILPVSVKPADGTWCCAAVLCYATVGRV
jgi:hypothetical protein